MMGKAAGSHKESNGILTCSLTEHGCATPSQGVLTSLERLFSAVPSSSIVLYPNAEVKYSLLALTAPTDHFTSPPFHPPRG
jgi:hypothetical protein